MHLHPTESRITVLVSIAEPFLRAGICACLVDQSDISVVDAESGATYADVDVVVADLPTAAEVVEEGRRCAADLVQKPARILAITGQVREHAIRCAIERGIHGFVLTNSPVCDLVEGVRLLAGGRAYLCPQLMQRLASVAGRDRLTSREDDVLALLAKGRCNKSIGRELGITVGTVKVHVKSIMFKLDASSRTEAASVAVERGLVDMSVPAPRQWETPAYATHRQGASLQRSRCA